MVKTPTKKKRYMGAASKMSGRSNVLGSPKATRPAFCFCKCCQRHFSVSHAGINDVKKHENMDLHKRSIQAGKQSSINNFMLKRVTTMLSQVKLCSVTSSWNITSPLQWLTIFPN